MSYDYQFAITELEGKTKYYIERYSWELSDKELQEEMNKIIREGKNVKSVHLDRLWKVASTGFSENSVRVGMQHIHELIEELINLNLWQARRQQQ